MEREQLASVVRRLVIDADDFFAQQQKTLQLSYAELNSRIEQLRMRVQQQQHQQQQQQLSPLHSANGRYSSMNPSPFSTVHSMPNADLMGLPTTNTGVLGNTALTPSAANAMNATPLRSNAGVANRSLMSSLNGQTASLSMADALSENARNNGGIGGYLSSALNGTKLTAGASSGSASGGVGAGGLRAFNPDAVTPPNKQLALSQPASKSPSMPQSHLPAALNTFAALDDGVSGEYFSTAPNRNSNRSQHDSLMASPQATQKLSLEDLIERFHMSSAPANTTAASAFNFDSLYEQLTGGSGPEESSQSPLEYTESPLHAFSTAQTRQAQSSPYERHQDHSGDHSPEANGFGGGTVARNSIPVDTLRALHDQHLTTSVRSAYERGRPKVLKVASGSPDTPERLGIDPRSPCEVLVEFKRKRVLQYESHQYVAPGSYVVVGGDRGEDLGVVVYVWCEVASDSNGGGAINKSAPGGRKRRVVGVGLTDSKLPRNLGVGNGTVLRHATETDVQQLLGTQAELERRAIDVCAQLVLDHSLPMVIVDAEYQFDKKKLTFFYEAQQRMDFRELVRHLYKTFRARIWMELVDA